MTARLFTLDPLEGFRPKNFAGHRDAVMGAYFSLDAETVNSLLSLFQASTNKNRSILLVGMVQSSFGKPNLILTMILSTLTKFRIPHSPLCCKTLVTRLQARDGAFTSDTTSVNLGRRLFAPLFMRLPTSLSLDSPLVYLDCGRCLRFLTSIH
jgi:hypothetical protein